MAVERQEFHGAVELLSPHAAELDERHPVELARALDETGDRDAAATGDWPALTLDPSSGYTELASRTLMTARELGAMIVGTAGRRPPSPAR